MFKDELLSIFPEHYCSTGMYMNKGRQIAETHYIMCLEAGLSICGINSEVLAN
jgi:hypothetical protein